MGVKKYPNQPKNFGKTSRTPRRPYEKERLDSELTIIGEFGLKNKRELWRVQLTLAKIRSTARRLLTLEREDPRRIFEGSALLRRLTRLGVLGPDQQHLENCLTIKVQSFLKRRLQTLVKDIGVESVHRARVLIYQRHIRVGHQVVTSPSFLVREKSARHINFREGSSLGGGPPGKVKRRNLKRKLAKQQAEAAGGDAE